MRAPAARRWPVLSALAFAQGQPAIRRRQQHRATEGCHGGRPDADLVDGDRLHADERDPVDRRLARERGEQAGAGRARAGPGPRRRTPGTGDPGREFSPRRPGGAGPRRSWPSRTVRSPPRPCLRAPSLPGWARAPRPRCRARLMPSTPVAGRPAARAPVTRDAAGHGVGGPPRGPGWRAQRGRQPEHENRDHGGGSRRPWRPASRMSGL